MIKILQEFIREELVWNNMNSWLRRPRNNKLGDVSDEIEAQRRSVFNSTKDDMQSKVERLRHTLSTSMSIRQMYDALEEFGEDPNDIAADSTMLARATEDKDIDEVRRQLTTGLNKWEDETMKWSEQNDYDTSSLIGHPMRSVGAGGNTFKKKNGP